MEQTDRADATAIAQAHRAYYEREMADRAARPLGAERLRHVKEFTGWLRDSGARSVLEVGCGAGRDGVILASSGVRYLGIDVTPAAVEACRSLGLDAVEASATELPLDDGSIDAVWSMSTLMHLTDEQLDAALSELRRVVRSGGVVEVGVWGHTTGLADVLEDGRFFNRRTDADLRTRLAAVGEVTDFQTWDRSARGHHYQWARVLVA